MSKIDNVSSNQCLDDCSSSLSTLSSCSSSVGTILDSSSVSSCVTDTSSGSIHFQSSLLLLINTHLHYDLRFPSQLMEWIHQYSKEIGYVSRRFFELYLSSVKVVLETNAIEVRSSHLPLLLSFASFFSANVQSVLLDTHQYELCESLILNHNTIISGVTMVLNHDLDYTSDSFFKFCDGLFDSSSTMSLPSLKRLKIINNGSGLLNGIVSGLISNNTLLELSVSEVSTMYEIWTLEKIFSSNKTLKIVTLADLWGLDIMSSFYMSIFNSSSIRVLTVSATCLDFDVCNALKTNLVLKELTVICNYLKEEAKGLSEVIKGNSCLKKLELRDYNYDLTSIIRSFETNSSLSELVISKCESSHHVSFTDMEVQSLEEMVQKNTGLLVLGISTQCFNSFQLKNVLLATEHNQILKKVILGFSNFFLDPCSDLCCLIAVYESMVIKPLSCHVDVDPHFVDVENSVFCFSPKRCTQITDEEVSSLKYFVKSFCIKELTLSGCSFTDEAITALCDLIKDTESLTSIDLSSLTVVKRDSHHDSDHDNSVVNNSFSCTEYSDDERSSTQFFLPDWSDKELSDDHFCKIVKALQFNSGLNNVDLSNSISGFNTLLTVFELISLSKLPPTIDVSPHYICSEDGVLDFSPKGRSKITCQEISYMRSLMDCFSIESLVLCGCSIFDETFSHLCDLIKGNNSLTLIDLKSCCFDDDTFSYDPLESIFEKYMDSETVVALVNALEDNYTISLILLHSDSIDSETVEYVNEVREDRIICYL
ncbi:hypothetical protein GEMRC1_011522 [Eukaryota sp. GEM-RC1]